MNKIDDLAKLEQEMAVDESLPLREANLVFGEGDPERGIMFIGEGPGYHEDKQGRPFVGRAGQLLDILIRDAHWKREEVYITNIIKHRPPNNRDPLPNEIEAYKPYLTRQIKIIDPKVIAPLGRFAMNYFIPDAKISRDRGKIFWLNDTIVMPLYHPAAALRSTQVKKDLELDFKKFEQVVERYDEFVEEHRKKRAEQKNVSLTNSEKTEQPLF